MANNKMIVDERQRELGQFLVGRLLPFRKKRQVGPFTFIDHMGPSTIGPEKFMDVDQHPHIGLSTLTYLFEGSIEHRDSTGSLQVVRAGDVAFMTAGRGVTHTERTPADMRDGSAHRMHGYQVWVALPKELEEMEPRFDFYSSHELPSWKEHGLDMKLVIGSGFGRRSPLTGYSDMFMVDIEANERSTIDFKDNVQGELAMVVVRGEIKDGDDVIGPGQMLISKTDEQCSICIDGGTRLMLFGGRPLPEERFLLWNFVSSSKERLARAKEDWQQKRFDVVPGDGTYIPFP